MAKARESCYDSVFEGDEEGGRGGGQRQMNVQHRRLRDHSVEYRANILLIAFNPLHLWGL